VPPIKSVRDKVDSKIRFNAVGRKCKRHPRKPVKIGFVWADGRAYGYACTKECFLDWEKSQGKWACVVRVIQVNRRSDA